MSCLYFQEILGRCIRLILLTASLTYLTQNINKSAETLFWNIFHNWKKTITSEVAFLNFADKEVEFYLILSHYLVHTIISFQT